MKGIAFSATADRKVSYTAPSKRTLPILILISCSLTLSGCVYLRLLKVKKQFKQFDKYVMVDKEDGLTFSFLQPILYADDIKWLGLPPVFQKTESGTTTWRHVLEKITTTTNQSKEITTSFSRHNIKRKNYMHHTSLNDILNISPRISLFFSFTFSEQDFLINFAIRFPFIGKIEFDFSESDLHAAAH